MKQNYDAIVIGSGLGGLTAGALFARAGHDVLVLERNEAFGGAAGTYERGGRLFEASLHETTPLGAPGDPKAAVFRALGLDDVVELVPIEIFQEVRSPLLGTPLRLPHGLDKVEAALAERFPADHAAIHGFLTQIGRSQEALAAFSEHHDGQWWLGRAADLPLDLWALVRDMGSTLSEVMQRHFGAHEVLKLVMAANLGYYSENPDRLWWLAYAVAQGGYLHSGAYYIKGGSGWLVENLVRIVREEGGTALTGHSVTRVLTDPQGRANGVQVTGPDGTLSEVHAPVIFANAAPEHVAAMLATPIRAAFMEPFAGRRPSVSAFTISYALNRPAAEIGLTAYSTQILPEWMETLADFKAVGGLTAAMPGDRLPPLAVVDYGHVDSGLATGQPAPVCATAIDRLENWDGLSDADYAARKAAWVAAVTARLDAEWPGFAAAVVSADMATARTLRDRLGTPGGAVLGFDPEVPRGLLSVPQMTARTSVPGLWLASAWAGMGGYTGAMGMGAVAARAALRTASHRA
ncbi:MAG: NAD(P)-binding protein [Rhodobacteraceae bacterium]|nr:NAD(P)-binding protein [Paracoccaceae bacterium]